MSDKRGEGGGGWGRRMEEVQSGLHLSSSGCSPQEKERVSLPPPPACAFVGGSCFAGDLIGLDVKRNLCKLKEGRKKKERCVFHQAVGEGGFVRRRHSCSLTSWERGERFAASVTDETRLFF